MNIPTRWAAAGLLALLAAGCTGADAKTTPPPQARGSAQSESAVRVELAKVAPSKARLEFTLPGEIEGAHDALLAAALGGYVEAVLAKEGAKVKKGDVLVRVDTSLHSARHDQARADFEHASAELARVQTMGEAVSRAQRDAARTRVAISQAALRAAQVQVSRSLIRAPFDGTVAQLEVEVGEIAPPGAPIARVVQLDPVVVSVSVADRDVVALRTDMPVTVTTDASPEVFPGKVTRVGRVSDLRTRAFTVKAEVANPEQKLLPGMIARVKIASELATDALVVPQDVMVTRMNEVGVFVEDQGVARWRKLTLGQVVGNQVVVTAGLAPGERVVVTGHRELVEGDRLSPAREGTCCTAGRIVFGEETPR